jgi:DNA-binding CsgD family transcriptional regulator
MSTHSPSPHPAPRAHHLRLSQESWAEIGRAYCNGATARSLAQHWRISPKTIYAHAKRNGWSKQRNGDDIVRAAHRDAPAPEGPAFFRLDAAAWAEIGKAFCNGATAKALAAQWGVSATTILTHARRHGWQAHRFAQAHARAEYKSERPQVVAGDLKREEIIPPEGMMFAPDPKWYLDRYTDRELFDPGMTAQIAASASCGAMLVGDLQESLVLAQIAYAHTRIAKAEPTSLRQTIWRALTDEAACNDLFAHGRRDGEEDLKHAYWTWRQKRRDREAERGAALAAANARIKALEAQLAAR